MTERIYYTDARLTTFAGTVVSVEQDGHHVVLDRTAFYPTSGGQPHDIGELAGPRGRIRVIDVIDEDERIVHVCESPMGVQPGDAVDGVVDWIRRFDHMQQHTGQHLLSALLADEYAWPTVSVHFGAGTNTVDVAAAQVDPDLIATIEQRANQLLAENRTVSVSFEDSASATGLRKASDRDGLLRIITIDGVDKSACGGTHVSQTGEVGSMLLRRMEKTKGNTRIEFVCGLRAVARARADAAILTTTSRMLTSSPEDLPTLLETQQKRMTELERERKHMVAELSRHEAQSRWNAATPDAQGVKHVQLDALSGPVRDAEPLVQALVALGSCLVLATSPSTGGVMFGASEGTGADAGALLKSALQSVSGRGGGSPRVAQGSVPDANALPQIAQLLGFDNSKLRS